MSHRRKNNQRTTIILRVLKYCTLSSKFSVEAQEEFFLDTLSVYWVRWKETTFNKPLLPSSYTLMTDCWKKDPDERPSFEELVERVEQMLLREVEYFDLNKMDESKDYYRVQESKTAEIDEADKIEQ